MLYDASSTTDIAYQVANTTAQHIIVSANEQPYADNSFLSKFKIGSSINLDKFIQALDNVRSYQSRSKCAKYIRMALESAGARFNGHPVAASDWGSTLESIGYQKITPAFDNPREGDIYIIHRTGRHVYGHIAGYSGSGWVSDFKQRSYDVYRDSNVSYSYYRLAS